MQKPGLQDLHEGQTPQQPRSLNPQLFGHACPGHPPEHVQDDSGIRSDVDGPLILRQVPKSGAIALVAARFLPMVSPGSVIDCVQVLTLAVPFHGEESKARTYCTPLSTANCLVSV